jgi:hypothetical protein
VSAEPTDLIGPDEVAFTLDLTPAQLKLTHAALKAFLNDFGHNERAVHTILHEILAKLPDEASIRSIDLDAELRRRRPA